MFFKSKKKDAMPQATIPAAISYDSTEAVMQDVPNDEPKVKYQCPICGSRYEEAPDLCPVCRCPKSRFVTVKG